MSAPFFYIEPATTEIYTLSLHDALPIFRQQGVKAAAVYADSKLSRGEALEQLAGGELQVLFSVRSEEHTSELQSRPHLVCRLLLEKKKLINEHTQARLLIILYRAKQQRT